LLSQKQEITDFMQGFRQEYYPEWMKRVWRLLSKLFARPCYLSGISCIFAKKLGEENPISNEKLETVFCYFLSALCSWI